MTISAASDERKERIIRMASMTRSEAREEIFYLLFESEFHQDKSPEEILALAAEVRGFCLNCNERQQEYIRRVYFGVQEKREEIDGFISKHSNGWRPDRIAPVSRNILRLCIYEMRYEEDVPAAVALNEAIELTKRFDEPKAKSFVNGILHSVKTELEAQTV